LPGRDRMKTGHAGTVLLLHGLGGTDWNLRYLGGRLGRTGLGVRYYRYPSRIGSLEVIAGGLADMKVSDQLCAYFTGEVS